LCLKCLASLGFGLGPNAGDDPAPREFPQLGDYELIEEVARGGMGVVYRARQLSLNRIVAVKVVLHGPFSSPEFVKRFRTEAEAAAGLQHPNIVAIHEIGQSGNDHFFSMDLVEGQNLADVVREKPLPARKAAEYLRIIAEAVAYAHSRGVLHRDLKPSNVLLDDFDQPRVTDFGLAKVLNAESELTTTGQVLGSPSHIPPEQAAGKFGEAGPAADIYSLGALLYQLLTGRPPFQGETIPEILLQVQSSDPVSPRRLNPSVPADLQTICLKCLQKEPSRRYASARELADELTRFLSGEPIRARAVSPVEKLWLWGKRRPALAAMIVALHLVLFLGIIGIIWQWQRAERNAAGERVQRQVAEEFADRVRLNNYAGEISFAAQALNRGNLGLARHALLALRPKLGEQDLRGFEWRYLSDQCKGDQLATLGAHDWIVTCAAFSPDGKYLATGSQDHTVKIWDVAQRSLVQTLTAATGAVWSVDFTHDSRYLMTSGLGGTRLWNYGNWELVKTFPGRSASLAKSAPLLATSDAILFYWWQPPGKIAVWNYETGEKVFEPPKLGRAIAIAPDGRTLAVGDRPRNIDLWDVDSQTLIRTLGSSNSAWALEFSSDGKQFLALTGGEHLYLWDLNRPTNAPPRRWLPHQMGIWTARFSPDGNTVATASSDQTLRLTDVDSLQTRVVLRGHESEVWTATFSPDGKLIATGGKDQKVMLWSGLPRKPSNTFPHRRVVRPFFSPDGSQLITGSPTGTNSQLWSLNHVVEPMTIPGARVMGFSLDGRRFVRWAAGGKALEFQAIDSTNCIRVPLDGCDENSKGLQIQGFSADWKFIFAIDELGRIGVWHAESGKLRKGLVGPSPPISAGALSPDGHYLAIGAQQEKVVRLFDCDSGQEWKLAGHKDTVRCLDFSPDGTVLASGSLDGSIRLWSLATKHCLAVLPGHMEETSALAFSPDGNTLASANLELSIKLWHLPTRRELLSWEFLQASEMLRFSPDGKHLAIVTRTHSVYFFAAPQPGTAL